MGIKIDPYTCGSYFRQKKSERKSILIGSLYSSGVHSLNDQYLMQEVEEKWRKDNLLYTCTTTSDLVGRTWYLLTIHNFYCLIFLSSSNSGVVMSRRQGQDLINMRLIIHSLFIWKGNKFDENKTKNHCRWLWHRTVYMVKWVYNRL